MRVTAALPWILIYGVIVPAGAAPAQERLDLDGAINHALQRNRSLIASGLDRDAAAVGIAAAEARFQLSVRPVVELSTSGDDGEAAVAGVDVSKLLRTGAEVSTRLISEDPPVGERRERAVLELRQPLFRFAGRLVNEEPVIQATNALKSSRRRVQQQQIDLIVEVVRSYEDILRLERQTLADEKALERADRLYRSTKAREALGRASRIDTLRVELQRGRALSRLEGDREALASARRAFAELLGFQPGTDFTLQPTRLLEVDFGSLDDAARSAYENRLDYAEAIQNLYDASRAARIARRQLLPDVSVVARYEYRNETLVGGADQDDNVWFLGIRSDTDFNMAAERAAVQQARIGRESADQLISILELRIARELQQRVLAYRRAHAEVKILERNLKHARSRLLLAQRLFEIGRGDNFSVTDAEEAFLRAESDYLTGRANASISGYELLRTMGTLTEVPEDLKPAVYQP